MAKHKNAPSPQKTRKTDEGNQKGDANAKNDKINVEESRTKRIERVKEKQKQRDRGGSVSFCIDVLAKYFLKNGPLTFVII